MGAIFTYWALWVARLVGHCKLQRIQATVLECAKFLAYIVHEILSPPDFGGSDFNLR